MDRRHFLQHALLAASTTLFSSAARWSMAAPTAAAPAPDAPRFLLIFLRGGWDAANVLVPYAAPFYYEARPGLALPRPGEANGVLALNGDWGLHPALAGLANCYRAGECAIVPFAGTDDLSRSHFETQDSIELGQGEGGRRDLRSGFLNRLAQVLQARGTCPAMAFTAQRPLVLAGAAKVANGALRDMLHSAVSTQQSQAIEHMYQSSTWQERVDEGFATRAQIAQRLRALPADSFAQAGGRGAFFEDARRIAALLRDQYTLGFVDIGGWDTHVNQGAAQGTLAQKLADLDAGLSALREGMGPAWAHTVVWVMSEFGRTFRENGKSGTDHGHGSVHFALGGAVRGARLIGEQSVVRPDTLFQNRDFPVLNEYRSLLDDLFTRLYGLNEAERTHIFPGARRQAYGVV